MGTFGFALGKIVSAVSVDHFGGSTSFALSLVIQAFALLLIRVSQTYESLLLGHFIG